MTDERIESPARVVLSSGVTPAKCTRKRTFEGDRFVPIRGHDDNEGGVTILSESMPLFHAERAARFAAFSPAASGQSIMPCVSPCDDMIGAPIHTVSHVRSSPVVRQLFRAC